MSLRDQLLKSGLVNKKQAAKAANTARQDERKRSQSGAPVASAQISDAIKREQEERRERDRQLNRDREDERRRKETYNQAREIVYTNDERDHYADGPYYFKVGDTLIKSIRVTDLQRQQLARGSMGICAPDTKEDDFFLLTSDACGRVSALEPQMVVCLYDTRTEEESSEPDHDGNSRV